MKTQAELREIAECITEAFADDRRPLYRDAAQLAADYLRLTDPTPLTAEHCREAGCRGCGGENKRWDFGRNYAWMSDNPDMHIESPTVGQLRLALLKENRDGE